MPPAAAPLAQRRRHPQLPHARGGGGRVFGNLASFYENQQLLQQTPPPMSDLAVPDIEGARLLIESVLAERRRSLTELESKALLAAFHIPVTRPCWRAIPMRP